LLPYHPAFWDELQPLPLPGLDEHLVLAVERTGVQGQTALHFLSAGHQRWAAQAAQIELDARRLAACHIVADIPGACQQVVAGELSNAASSVLRAFSRIGADIAAALAQESLYHQRLALTAVEERLDGLLRELTRSNERYATRFQPIAAAIARSCEARYQSSRTRPHHSTMAQKGPKHSARKPARQSLIFVISCSENILVPTRLGFLDS